MVDITSRFHHILEKDLKYNIANDKQKHKSNASKRNAKDLFIDASYLISNKIKVLNDFLIETKYYIPAQSKKRNFKARSNNSNADEFTRRAGREEGNRGDNEEDVNINEGVLTDEERNIIDIEVHAAVTDIAKRIDEIRVQLPNTKAQEGSSLAHKQGVIVCLLGKLQQLNECVKNQQISRQKQILMGSSRSNGICRPDMVAEIQTMPINIKQNEDDEVDKNSDNSKDKSKGKSGAEAKKLFEIDKNKSNASKSRSKARVVINDEEVKKEIEKELGLEMIKVFEQENALLEEQLTNELEEARVIERNMVNLSQLISVLSEKVVEQREAIDTIFQEAVDNVNTVSQVPEELRQAKERNSAYKRYAIMFLLFMSISLLFLDFVD